MPGNKVSNRSFPVWLCLKLLMFLATHLYVRAIIIVIGSLLITVSWPQFTSSNPVYYYIVSLIICLVLTFIEKGFCDKHVCWGHQVAFYRERYQRQQLRQEEPESAQQALLDIPRSLQIVAPWLRGEAAPAGQPQPPVDPPQPVVEFHQAAGSPSSDGRVFISINEPADQAVPSTSGINLRQSSTDPSIQPFQSIPSDNVTNEPRNDESLHQADSGNNVPPSSTDPSAQSTRSTGSDGTNEEPQSDEPLQPVESSDSGNNVPKSSTDPSTQSTPLDDLDEGPRSGESLQQAVPSDSGRNLPQSRADPSVQSTLSTPLEVLNTEPRSDESSQAMFSDSGSNLPESRTDPTTQSDHSTPLDVTNEESRSDVPLQQTQPSNSSI